MKIVKEKSIHGTKKFVEMLERRMGFKIHTIQIDNGTEFVNDGDKTSKESAFEKAPEKLDIKIRRIRPYSPWQNEKIVFNSQDANACLQL